MPDPTNDTPLLVSLSVWIALACYPAGLTGRIHATLFKPSRWLWTLGCVAFQIHALASYGLVYNWSHSIGLSATARQTADLTGLESGFGLYLNLCFAALWLLDVCRWWLTPTRVRGKLGSSAKAMHTFFLFMMINGAFVFAPSPQRWLGLALTLVSAWLLFTGGRALNREAPAADRASDS